MSLAFPITDLPALLAYALAMSITPGPNNAMLASLGARYGMRATMPAVAGVATGFASLIVAAAMGVTALLGGLPGAHLALVGAGAAYMAYLAWHLWHAGVAPAAEARPPVGFWGAVALQAVNPKGILMATTVAGTFLAPSAGLAGATMLAAIFSAVGLPCILLWALAGDRLQAWLAAPVHMRLFSRGMAAVLALTVVGLLVPHA